MPDLRLERLAERALTLLPERGTVGLGTGRAAEAFIAALGKRVEQGWPGDAIVTSVRSERAAHEAGIPLIGIEELVARGDRIAIAFDGADEITPRLELTKGLGGALLRERVVEHEAERFIVLVTEEKCVARLATRAPIPVEVVPFALAAATRNLADLGVEPVLRRDAEGAPFQTDNGNAILDLKSSPLADPQGFDREVRAVPGVVDTGLFLAMAERAFVAGEDGIREIG